MCNLLNYKMKDLAISEIPLIQNKWDTKQQINAFIPNA
jgi:hypothetical protein